MKKNNKGFSLVELIVVVLIMGIIAVALAPQVMKWVGTARTNSDDNTKKDLKSAIQVAVADYQGENGPLAGAESFEISEDGMDDITSDELKAKVIEVLGNEYPEASSNNPFWCTITAAGQVTVSDTAPAAGGAGGATPTT